MTRYYHPPDIQSVQLQDRVIFDHKDEYVEIEGESVCVVKDVLPEFEKGVEIATVAKRTDYSEETVEELVTLLLQYDLLHAIEDGRDIPDDISPDRYHLEARTGTAYAAEALSHLQDRNITVITPPKLEDDIELDVDFRVTRPGETLVEHSDSIIVNVCFGDSPEQNHRLNEQAIKRGFDFLPVRVFHTEFVLGPLFLPGETVGFETAYKRERANAGDPDQKLRFDEQFEDHLSFPLTHEMATLISGTLETELKRYLLEYGKPNTIDATVTIDFETLDSERRSILRLPNGDHSR
jgi:hypothetical protein